MYDAKYTADEYVLQHEESSGPQYGTKYVSANDHQTELDLPDDGEPQGMNASHYMYMQWEDQQLTIQGILGN